MPSTISPGLMSAPVMMRAYSTTPTAKPARSYSPTGYMPGISAVSPPISAQPGLFAAEGDALDDFGGGLHIQLAAGEIIEEEQRLRTLH